MSNFKATNNFNLTRFAFYERLRYKLMAFANSEHDNIKILDYSDFTFYGKVRQDFHPVYLSDYNNLKEISNGNMALDFVCDAFKDLMAHFKNAVDMEVISMNEKYLSDLKCVNAFQDPISSYVKYINEIFSLYNNLFIVEHKIKINSFDDYVDNLILFMKKLTSEFPITFSGWLSNKRSSPFVSGMYINIAGFDFGDDTKKEKDIINSLNFDFYVSSCKSRGFYVLRHNPSILVPDFGSEAMLEYMKGYGVQSLTKLLSFDGGYYDLAYKTDMELFSKKIYEYYNKYVDENELISDVKISRNNKIYTEIKYRERKNYNNINNNILIKLYTNIKNIEEDYVFGVSDVNRIIKNATNINNAVDIQAAVRYINREYGTTFRSKYGSLNYYDKKLGD
jgi:hypothetical protein